MAAVTHELIYFSGDAAPKRDFSGEDHALPLKERMAFLTAYQQQARSWYDDEGLDQKAVSQQDVDDFCEMLTQSDTKIRKTIRFDTARASKSYKEPEYLGLHLYCGAYLKGKTLIFPGREIRPTPCALWETGENVTSFSVSIYIPAGYKSTQNRRCSGSQGGRVIELRCGTLDKVKIKLCNSGEIFAMTRDKWEPSHVFLCPVHYGDWNEIRVDIGENVRYTVNGVTVDGIEPTVSGPVDSIFFDGGMFPREGWQVKDLTVNGKPVDFKKNPKFGTKAPIKIGEVSLPYAIGGWENRDQQLILTKTFHVDAVQEAWLNVESLDPCGRVLINGQPVLDTDTFTANRIRVTPWLQPGENTLEILVEPRAPEVYYFWHRHDDCYNGWFCGAVTLELIGRQSIIDLKIKTLTVQPQVQAVAQVDVSETVSGELLLYAAKCWPEREEEIFLTRQRIMGSSVQVPFSAELALWSDEAPNLYTLRAELLLDDGTVADDFATETGFRTICQKNGAIYLNDRKTGLYGALIMQFLPPIDAVPVNHNCPTMEQIAWQGLMLKAMNGNFMRLHMLGYGSNDRRYARICDRLGIMLVWITRFIDTLEELVWDDGCWHEEAAFIDQIRAVMNHPSVIMYEGSNEYHPDDLAVIDRMYDRFTQAVTAVDDSRLLCPCSHLYYGGGLYDVGCTYYLDDGSRDQSGAQVCSGPGWVHPNVVRSAHTYSLLCGYGETWQAMRAQSWPWQQELLQSEKHSYLITEFAVAALPNASTAEALQTPYPQSYERPDELGSMGVLFDPEQWRESQALQALCAFHAVKLMRTLGADGMAWCCLSSGANNGSYMKPPIDFYGYKKLGFYALKDAYRKTFACKDGIDVSLGTGDAIRPRLFCDKPGLYDVNVCILDAQGRQVQQKAYENLSVTREQTLLPEFTPAWTVPGYYTIRFTLRKQEE